VLPLTLLNSGLAAARAVLLLLLLLLRLCWLCCPLLLLSAEAAECDDSDSTLNVRLYRALSSALAGDPAAAVERALVLDAVRCDAAPCFGTSTQLQISWMHQYIIS
jgi:hypothetical protein